MNGRAWKVAAVALASSLGLALVGCTDSQAPNPSATSLELSGPAAETTELAPESGPRTSEQSPQHRDGSPAPRDDDPGNDSRDASARDGNDSRDERGGTAPETQAPAATTGRSGAPCAVSGYSGEGESDRREEGFTQQQVADAVAQGCDVAEYDDGVWEVDLDWIEVEIRPDGTVTEVDD